SGESANEPTKHQLSSRLLYSQRTPAFLRKLQGQVSGIPDDNSGDENQEFEDDGSGRPPIPRHPVIPERPTDNPGSGDEDVDDEALRVVVLKEGKHLSEREVQHEKYKGETEGREPSETQKDSPLPDPAAARQPSSSGDAKDPKKKSTKEEAKGLSFSSRPSSSTEPTTAKRKAIGDGGRSEGSHVCAPALKGKTKKPKVGLSFADDAMTHESGGVRKGATPTYTPNRQ
ncbi:hypothetical protein EDB83DRAFT_2344133, partial [Lactarius deliciosus]